MKAELRDPVKEVQAQVRRLARRRTTRAAVCAREGQDWKAVFRRVMKEEALAKELGVPAADAKPPAPPHTKRSKA